MLIFKISTPNWGILKKLIINVNRNCVFCIIYCNILFVNSVSYYRQEYDNYAEFDIKDIAMDHSDSILLQGKHDIFKLTFLSTAEL